MSEKCIYCSRKTRKSIPAGDGGYVCDSCASKSQDYMKKLLRLWKPHLADALLPEPEPTPEEKELPPEEDPGEEEVPF